MRMPVRLTVAVILTMLSGAVLAQPVGFAYEAPRAKAVYIAGSFPPAWLKRYPMTRGPHGRWQTVLDLPPGRYEFQFLVNGTWHVNPDYSTVDDGLGGRNNVVLVVP